MPLPCSSCKKETVTKTLTEKKSSSLASAEEPRVRPNALTYDTKLLMESFYRGIEVSRVAPGKADVLSVRNKDGSKSKLQNQHMLMSIKEAYNVFKELHPYILTSK